MWGEGYIHTTQGISKDGSGQEGSGQEGSGLCNCFSVKLFNAITYKTLKQCMYKQGHGYKQEHGYT